MKRRIIISAFAAPLIGVPVAIIPIVLMSIYARTRFQSPNWTFDRSLGQAIGMSMYALVVAWLVMLGPGLQVHRLLGLVRKRHLWHYAAAGLTVGAMPFLPFFILWLFDGRRSAYVISSNPAARWLLMGAASGAASSMVFWALAVRHKHD